MIKTDKNELLIGLISEVPERRCMHIEHIAIWTHDLDGMRDFYETWFNAEVGRHYTNLAKGEGRKCSTWKLFPDYCFALCTLHFALCTLHSARTGPLNSPLVHVI